MRVLMVSKACLVGAYQTKLEAIAREEDVDLTVVVPPSWDDPASPVTLERSHTAGYELLVDPIRFNGHYHLHYYPRLGQRLDAVKPDILHMDEEPYNLATWLAVRQAHARGIHTLFFSWQNLVRRYPWPFSWMERDVLRAADYAIMGNRAAVEVWQSKGYRGPHAVIPQFGVSPELFHPRLTATIPGTFVIGAANRRLVRAKGEHLLLQAAAGLTGEWRLLIAGEGPERPRLADLADKLGIADRVQFEGTIASEAMPAFLRRLDVLVLPSMTTPQWMEQFGRVLIEAMVAAVPVIGSDSGEIPNVIGDAGLVFPEGDVGALAARLATLMTDPDRRRSLSEAGRARALDQYTQAQIAAQTVAVYRRMVSKT